MPASRAVGIDLGTTNSAAAWVDDTGRSAMIANAECELITPSIVYFGEREVVVGKFARKALADHPDMVAQWAKREMGAPAFAQPIHGHQLPPEVIQACILRKLKDDIVRYLGPDSWTVITVPAYFDELRRKVTADAGEMAGLRVLDIVNEPTAAALAYAEVMGYLSPTGSPQGDMTVLVYDLGGGTFDATLMRFSAGSIRTVATDGDVRLGGHDWDERLVRYAAEAFTRAYQMDPREDPATRNQLFEDAMEAKHRLSAAQRAALQVNHAGRSSDVTFLREHFEEMTADLLQRTAFTTEQLLRAAGLGWDAVDGIFLSGGSTRMPMVREMLRRLSGKEPAWMVNPDEAVARGAALYAKYLLSLRNGVGQGALRHVADVNSHSLGIETIEPYLLRKRNVILIPRNTRLPAQCARKFATKSEGQRSIVIQVLEGESDLPDDCLAIGRTVVRDLPAGLPKGYPVEILFEYGPNGRLKVDAVVPGTPHQGRLELERDAGVSGDGIARWRQVVSAAGAFDSFVCAALEQGKAPRPTHDSGVGAVDLDATEPVPQLPSGTTTVGKRQLQVSAAELAQIKVKGEPAPLADAPVAAVGIPARAVGLAFYVLAILLGAGGGWYIYRVLTSR